MSRPEFVRIPQDPRSRDRRPRWSCPHCGREFVAPENFQNRKCPHCGGAGVNRGRVAEVLAAGAQAMQATRERGVRNYQAALRETGATGQAFGKLISRRGAQGQRYQAWRNEIMIRFIRQSGLQKGDSCPFCSKPIEEFVLHHILDRDSFPALRTSEDNVFPGCGEVPCGGVLDDCNTEERFRRIRANAISIAKARLPWLSEITPKQLIAWCYAMAVKHKVKVQQWANGGSKQNAN